MSNEPESACLAIADIAGYTRYLAEVELDHAQDILADLVGTVVRTLRPPFRLAKLEGDAAFVYLVADRLDGSAVQDTIEGTYFAFRRRLRDIRQASHCDCNACTLMPTLDLKLVIHHGEVIRHRVAGREELIGGDVILAHRLLKNSVTESTGLRAYALYTQPCVEAMGIDPEAQGLVEHGEEVEPGRQLTVWLRDLDAAWQDEQRRAAVRVEPEDAHLILVGETPAPPPLVWEYITSPIRRPQWSAAITEVRESSPTGRRGPGTTNHCVHGRDAIVEEILDWRPPHYWTTRVSVRAPAALKVITTEILTPLADGGTRIESRIEQPRPRDRAAFGEIAPAMEGLMRQSQADVLAALDAELASRAAAGEPPEPETPVSGQRFLTEPVTSGRRTVDSGGGRSSSS